LNAPGETGLDRLRGLRSAGWSRLFKAIVPLGSTVLALFLITLFVDVRAVWISLESFDAKLLAPMVLIVVLLVSMLVPRLHLIVRQLGEKPLSFGFLWSLSLFSALAAYMVPVSALASVYRAAVIWTNTQIPTAVAFEISFHDKLIALVGLLVFAIALLPLQVLIGSPDIEIVVVQAALLVGGGAAFAIAVMLAARNTQSFVKGWLRHLGPTARRFSGNFRQPFLLWHVVLSAASVLLYAVILWLAIVATGVQIPPFILVLSVAPVIAIFQNLPIFYLGWGSREVAAIILLTNVVGIGAAEAAAASILVGVGFLVGSVPGLLFVPRYLRVRLPRIQL
jgi:uncharacterized membrane protein YbhN (UPF0104 family)